MNLLKYYTLDTNVFRYPSNPSFKNLAKRFWENAIIEVINGESVLGVPQEVIRELEIQAFTLKKKENDHINKLIKLCESNSDSEFLTIYVEHQLRKMSAYVRSRFNFNIKSDTGKNMNYGNISDARILYEAYELDSILVTSNTKDFLLYPLLFEQDDYDRIYDLLANEYINVTKGTYRKIHDDKGFQVMLNELKEIEAQDKNN